MKEVINTEKAPAAIGPYSQAIRVGKFIYTSGQIPLDPRSGEMVEGGIKEQAHRVMENLKAVLQAAGSSLEGVIKTTIFLADMQDFAAVNEAYGGYFPAQPPARSTVQVAALPKGALVEIEAVAYLE